MHTFFIYAPDKTDEGCYARRLAVRQEHLNAIAKNVQDGLKLALGGVLLSPESITGGDRKILGSVIFVEVETIEEARQVAEQDIYYTSGVWDPEKLVVSPFVAALGKLSTS